MTKLKELPRSLVYRVTDGLYSNEFHRYLGRHAVVYVPPERLSAYEELREDTPLTIQTETFFIFRLVDQYATTRIAARHGGSDIVIVGPELK